jgi:LmbE family N-acetylglucosaminyl deacetylase
VAPHPDDDVLGCGAYLASVAHGGRRVIAVYLTDGAGSHSGSDAYPPERLRMVRENEARRALERLGIRTEPRFLRRPDGTLRADGAAAKRLADDVRACVPDDDDVLVLGPWRRDPHPDHRAGAAIVERVARSLGVRYAEYFVWLAERGSPADRPRRDEGRTLRLATHAFTNAKSAALREHRSQLGDVVHDATTSFRIPETMIARALDGSETFVVPAR